MLDQFEVADLPFKPVVILSETETLATAASELKSKSSDLLVVTHDQGLIRGVAAADMVCEVSALAPSGPLSRLALLAVVEVPSSTPLLDAIRMVSKSGVGALAVRRSSGEFKLVSREALIDFNGWSLLFKARERRLASKLPPASASLN